MDGISSDQEPHLVAIVSTTRMESLLKVSLPSIFSQVKRPDMIYVVADSDDKLPKQQIQELNNRNIPVKFILNLRERNLSGAINTALSEILLDGFDPEQTFIAILDDDDWWEEEYLQSSMNAASQYSSDWVVSGIIRHDSTSGQGKLLSIPDTLDERSFLRGNPHVQGSNLFVRFSKILLAGGLDENLPTTTDRDLGLRLLALGDVRTFTLRRHMVHHLAFGSERLSERGSEKKCLGLSRFYDKYTFFMDSDDRYAFFDRARRYFGCEIEERLKTADGDDANEQLPISLERHANIVIGAIVSDPVNFENIIQSAIALKQKTNCVSALVVSDNVGLSNLIEKASRQLYEEGIELTVVSSDEAKKCADNGDLGQYYADERNRTGIAFGRTILHRYVYLKCLNYSEPVAWIIDDDVSLKNIYWGVFEREVTGNELLGLINKWRDTGVSVVVGKVGGDPPVPIMSTVRTQMLDLYFNLKAMLSHNFHGSLKNDPKSTNQIAKDSPAYFYDFPEQSFRHLETPVWTELQNSALDCNQGLTALSEYAKLLLRKAVLRPAIFPGLCGDQSDIYFTPDSEEFGPVRGGNTIVLDTERLRDFNNSSPRSGSLAYRRGDTLWAILNKRLGSRRPLRKTEKVVSTHLMLVQSRHREESFEEMREKLVADTLGSAFVRSIDQLLQEKHKRDQFDDDYYKPLNFSVSDVKRLLDIIGQEINKRVRQIFLNSWRIRGLAQSIRYIINEYGLDFDQHKSVGRRNLNEFAEICDRVETLFNRCEIENIVNEVKKFNREELIDFLNQFSTSCRQFSDALPIHYSEEEIKEIKEIVRGAFNPGELRIIGSGKEGVILSDRIHSFKYFHYGKFGMNRNTLKFLNDKVLGRKFRGMAQLEEILFVDGHLIFKEEYVKGESYKGGRIWELVALLKECKSNRIVIKNVAPKNLIVNDEGLKFVDLGRDLEPFTEKGYQKMCKRAYLTYRWHFRSDIHELLHKTNQDSDFPELFGFNYFHEMLEDKYTGEISVPFIMHALSHYTHKRILDYGCGKGQIADELSRALEVSVYDKDMSDFYHKHQTGSAARVLKREDLDRFSSEQEKFDIVLVSLVLCTVDEDEVKVILADARRLIRKGGELVVVICNPFGIHDRETGTHEKTGYIGNYYARFTFEKKMKITNGLRLEYHRPLEWYIDEIKKAGFRPTVFSESDGVSFETISPGSEFLMIRASASETPAEYDVSLMIKASPMEWRTIGFQVRHIVKQLEGPEKFKEKFIVTDRNDANFSRQYDVADVNLFEHELQELLVEGVIDRVFYASEDEATRKSLSERWFGVECTNPKSENGQPILTTLQGFEDASAKYILQLDSDCIILRDVKGASYLREMINVLRNNSDAITVSFPVCNNVKVPFTSGNGVGKWRTEVRNCLIHKSRLFSLRPMPNSIGSDGKLDLPWHRSLDKKLTSGPWESYRGSVGNAYFIHMPNSFKTDSNSWYNILRKYENSPPQDKQLGEVTIQTIDLQDLLESRIEEVIILVKGRNVPIPKLRRCFQSLFGQDHQEFGLIYVDAASDNGSAEYVNYIGETLFPGRLTLFRNYTPLTSMENIFMSVKSICKNPQSIIIMVDADDAIIGNDALTKIRTKYLNGSDLTVGTMLRTDKYKEYPVDFKEPRLNRGGNVWQHLRTFRKYLFDSIDPEDFKIQGEWIRQADDWAYMIPMVEMAKKPEFIHDVLYFYEPSPEKRARDVKKYEETIAKIVSKKPYRKAVIQ
ncbi:MAG: glycosyltransferase [Thermoplasmatales archaeon]|nr:glycosyltransferase [Thermoplasmatales archaeon]